MRQRGFKKFPIFKRRKDLFRFLADHLGEGRFLYLEFGVFKGESIAFWSQLLSKNSQALFHGFDSFEGLPEDWNPFNPKAMFSTSGQEPEIKDDRIRFFKGWFEDSLKNYSPPPHDRLLVNIDSDLYSSAKTVLSFLGPHLKSGDVIYFDEFYDRNHELRAFEDFIESQPQHQFRCIGASLGMANSAFMKI